MIFKIELSTEAASDLEALYGADRTLFRRILAKVESLADRPAQGKPLVGNRQGEYSLRVGTYRVIYEIDARHHTVYILTVKHRRDAY
jgi:mRNA interferase RelE/StbE